MTLTPARLISTRNAPRSTLKCPGTARIGHQVHARLDDGLAASLRREALASTAADISSSESYGRAIEGVEIGQMIGVTARLVRRRMIGSCYGRSSIFVVLDRRRRGLCRDHGGKLAGELPIGCAPCDASAVFASGGLAARTTPRMEPGDDRIGGLGGPSRVPRPPLEPRRRRRLAIVRHAGQTPLRAAPAMHERARLSPWIDQRLCGRNLREHHGDLAAHHVGQRRRDAAIGDVIQ